ncbi:MAG TPA: hypothetical protein VI976_00375 [Candidatus Omnitrophota bacterium]|nr:hypothetical protein [Candidatus Omnitrophota bacterium]
MKNYPLSAIRYTLILLLIFYSLGCEAFIRKFTRKPKKENMPKEEMVLAPEEYKAPEMSKEDLYRQHFLFWRTWQDELIASLNKEGNHKKQIDCINEAVKNLTDLRPLLNLERRKILDIYIAQLNELNDEITKDLYGVNVDSHRRRAESIRMKISKEFSYNKAKKDLV